MVAVVGLFELGLVEPDQRQAAGLGWFQVRHSEENIYKDNQAGNLFILFVGIAYF
ncbi:MAG: hypothetical protein WCK35_23355 [Chloroflexota bacterium]